MQSDGEPLGVVEPPQFDALVVGHDESGGDQHPLRQLWLDAARERATPLDFKVDDHGTWKGTWPMPSRSQVQAVKATGGMWPCGEQEALAVQTARNEYKWKDMPADVKPLFREAAKKGWEVWLDNKAVEILSPQESMAVRERLRREGKLSAILTPRFVFTDKHDGLRTASCPLPVKAAGRIVVPGYKDESAYEVRKDAPTGSRISIHLLLTFTASLKWSLLSADVKSAFLKGEEFLEGERVLYIGNVQVGSPDEPNLPLGKHGLARLRKGIFGLADSPRRWYLRLDKSLCRLGWTRSTIDGALWFLWSACGQHLEGMIVSHVDDLLFGGNDRARSLLKQLGDELGFGSLEENKFHYCGKLIEKHPNGDISISMREYHENLKPIQLPLHRRREPQATLMPSEQKQLRALLGSLQWLVAQVRFDMGFHLSVLQSEKGTIGTILKANSLLRRFKLNPGFALWFRAKINKNKK